MTATTTTLATTLPEAAPLYLAAFDDAMTIGSYASAAARKAAKARAYAKRCTEPWLSVALAGLRDADREAAELEHEFDTACDRAGALAEELSDEYDLPIEVAVAAVRDGATPREASL